MGLNLLNSNADPICPTYASTTVSLTTGKQANGGSSEFLNDGWDNKAGAGYGAVNQNNYGRTANSNNNSWVNDVLSQNIQPTYRNGLLSFGNTGLQS